MYKIANIYLFFLIFEVITSYIVIPFKGNNLSQIYNSNSHKDFLSDFIMSTYYNQIYIVLGIGNPIQNVIISIIQRQTDFLFNKKNCISFYNNQYIDKKNLSPNNELIQENNYKIGYVKNLSNTFYKNNISKTYQKNLFCGRENLKIDDYSDILTNSLNKTQILPYTQKNILNFGFVYEDTNINEEKKEDEEICGSIGLALYFRKDNNKFIEQLKSSNITNNYYWSFNYTSLDKGYIILGILPHEYNPNKYKSDNLMEIYTSMEDGDMKWGMDLNQIYFFSKNNEKVMVKSIISEGVFEFSFQLIVGSFSYQELIIKHFFQEFFDNNICSEEEYKLDINYSIIICKKENFENKIKNFPKLFLYNRSLQNIFELSYEDLFVKTNDYIYFLVIFRKGGLNKNNQTWKLGIPFLKRHQIIFNSDTKRIGYYVENKIYIKENKDKNIKNTKKSNNNEKSKGIFDSIRNAISIRTILEIIIILIFILILIYFGKKIYNFKTKQKKPYELQDEDYDYFSNNSDNKKKKDNYDINNNLNNNSNKLTGQIIEMKSN